MTIVNDIKLLFDSNTSNYLKDVIINKWGNMKLTEVYKCYQEELQDTKTTDKYIF